MQKTIDRFRPPPSAALWLSRLGPLGKCPRAPGTAGSAAGIPAACLLSLFPGPWQALLLLALFLLACYAAHIAEQALGKSDPGEIVIDELVGYLVTVIGFPLGLKPLLLGFLLFRLFDIWKPWPVKLLDNRHGGGFWVVADDVGAGLYGHVALWILLSLWK